MEVVGRVVRVDDEVAALVRLDAKVKEFNRLLRTRLVAENTREEEHGMAPRDNHESQRLEGA